MVLYFLITNAIGNSMREKLHWFFLNFLLRLIFLYLSQTSYRNIGYYCT